MQRAEYNNNNKSRKIIVNNFFFLFEHFYPILQYNLLLNDIEKYKKLVQENMPKVILQIFVFHYDIEQIEKMLLYYFYSIYT